jgi:P4 family phage/plasmid primase-like protien
MANIYGRHGKQLIEFLKTHQQPAGSKFTHVSAGNSHFTTGNYWIVEDSATRLATLLDAAVKESHLPFSIGEKPDEVGYILVDIDLHLEPPDEVIKKPSEVRRLRTSIPKEFFKDLAELYKQQIDQIFNVSTIEADKYGMHFFEKAHPTFVNGSIHDGFHALLEIPCTKETQYYIRAQVLAGIDKLLIAHGIKSKVKQTIEQIVDKQIIKNAWMMYGCAKASSIPYVLTASYKFLHEGGVVALDEDTIERMKRSNLTERFSIQRRRQNLDYRNDDIPKDIKRFFDETENRKNKVILSKKSEERKSGTTLDTISRLTKLLSCARADGRESWLHVGLCLRRLDDSLLDDWIEFSKKSVKYTDGECENLWATFKPAWLVYTIGSLYYWAKKDNEKGFYEVISDTVQGMILNCVKGSGLQHYDVAMILYHYYKDKYVCTDPKNKIWYEFNGTIWKQIKIGYSLTSKIPELIGGECTKLATEFMSKLMKSSDDMESKKYQSYLKEITSYSKNLRNDTFQKSVMNQCAIIFHREDTEFAMKLDKNPFIVACMNGVIDLNATDAASAFRQGTPDDLCSISTKQICIPYDRNSKEIKSIKEFLKQVLPRKKVRHHFMKVISSLLFGRNEEEKFYILTGSGGNGKSKLMELIRNAMGDYHKPFNIALLQKRRGEASGPNPALHKLRTCRVAEAGEPDKDSNFNTGMLKEWSGNDKVSSRTHHGEEEEWSPMFKLFLLCNDMPPLDSIDDGLIRRIEVIEFISRFVSKKTDSKDPYQFLRNDKLASKFEKWGPHFLSYMVYYYFTYYLQEKSTPPNCVVSATKAYEKANDKIKQFMSENFKQDRGKILELKDIAVSFRKWFISEMGFGTKVPTKDELEKYLIRHFKKEFTNKKLKGYTLLEDASDDEDAADPGTEAEDEMRIYRYDSDSELGVQDDYLSDGVPRGVPRDPIGSDSDQDTTFREMVARKTNKNKPKDFEGISNSSVSQPKKKKIGANEHSLVRNTPVAMEQSDSEAYYLDAYRKKNREASDIDLPSDHTEKVSIPDKYKSCMTDESDASIIPKKKNKKNVVNKMKIESDNESIIIFGKMSDEGSSESEPGFDFAKIAKKVLKKSKKEKVYTSQDTLSQSSRESKATEKERAKLMRKKAALEALGTSGP